MISGAPVRSNGMVANRIQALRGLEGRHVGVALRSGRRIEDCELVAAPRGRVTSIWVLIDGADTFVALDDLEDLWETAA